MDIYHFRFRSTSFTGNVLIMSDCFAHPLLACPIPKTKKEK